MATAELLELKNGSMTVKLTNVGATITSLLVPDAHGNLGDVVLGFDTVQPYLEGAAPYLGCIVGRVANRIKEGKFNLDGIDYSLPINNPPNSLHGGNKGFDKVIWDVVERESGQVPSIKFRYHSHDGEEGYPGDVVVTATYSLPSSTSLRLDMEAVPGNKATPVNLAQHTYWNLAGHDSGSSVLDHSIQIWATEMTPVGDDMIPTGEIKSVKGTPFDFTSPEKVGSRIHQVHGGGYDHNYVLSSGEERNMGGGGGGGGGLRRAARLKDPSTSRVMDLWTDAPGMQFYTGNYVDNLVGKGGALYKKHAGLCLETQGFPDAVNHPNFPSLVVRPGHKYRHSMLFDFSIQNE